MGVDKNSFAVYDYGRLSYGAGLAVQEEWLGKVQRGERGSCAIVVEHDAVVTTGARESENKLLVSEEELRARGVELYETRRGGGTTVHNPGQVVVYPIIDLRSVGLGVNEYVRELEGVGIELLGSFGVCGERREGLPGVWAGEVKVASIGVRVSRGVTYHGMAVNVCNDLSVFDCIVPCGIEGVKMGSVESVSGKKVVWGDAAARLAEIVQRVFGGERGAGV